MTVIYTCEKCEKKHIDIFPRMGCSCGSTSAFISYEGEEKEYSVDITTESIYNVKVKARDPLEAKLKADFEYGEKIEEKEQWATVIE